MLSIRRRVPGAAGGSEGAGIESICLRYTCQYKNATEGMACINENIVYTTYQTALVTWGDIVSRDNCLANKLYCNAPTGVCRAQKDVGEACAADKECRSFNCADASTSTSADRESLYNTQDSGVCAKPPSLPKRPGSWVYVVLALGIVITGVSLCTGLFAIHSRVRSKRNAEVREYHETQTQLRSEINELYEDAKLLVATRGARGSFGSYGSKAALVD